MALRYTGCGVGYNARAPYMTYSRRQFGKLALLAVGKINSTVNGVRVGVQTYSFRNVLKQPGDPVDGIIKAMTQVGLGECEIFEPELQPPALSANAPWAVTA